MLLSNRHTDTSSLKPSTKPWLLDVRSNPQFIIFSVSLALFSDSFLQGLVIPLFPYALENRAGVAERDVQHWIAVILGVYAIGSLIASPVCGFISDHVSTRRVPFVFGVAMNVIATAMLWIAADISLIILAMLLQGFARAVVNSVGQALLVDTASREGMVSALGYVVVSGSIGLLVGILTGGMFYEAAGYNAVFAVGLTLVLADTLLRTVLIEKKVAKTYDDDKAPPSPPSEPVDAIIPAFSSADEHQPLLPTISIDLDSSSSSSSSSSNSSTYSTISSAPSSLPEIQRNDSALLALIMSSRFICVLIAAFSKAIISTSFETTLTLFEKNMFHYTSAQAGLSFSLMQMPAFLSPVFGRICGRVGAKAVGLAGLLFCSATALLVFVTGATKLDEAIMGIVLVIVGFGKPLLTLVIAAETGMAVRDMEEDEPGRFGKAGVLALAYGLSSFAYQVGSLVGPFLSGYLVQNCGYRIMALAVGGICLSTCLPVAVFMSGKKKNDVRSNSGSAQA